MQPKKWIKEQTLLWIPIALAALIALEILIKPINFLFADDWLLAEYLSPNSNFTLWEMSELVNGHNVMSTKFLLIVLSKSFGEQTLLVFAMTNLLITLLACILIISKYVHKKSFSEVLIVSIIFLNFKQAQNFNMIISAHFIHSLFCIALYLSLTDTKYNKWRWIPLAIAPFTGGFGLALVFLEVLASIRNLKKNGMPEFFWNLFFCFVLLTLAYGISLFSSNIVKNEGNTGLTDGLQAVLTKPEFLLSFLTSLLGAQFTPSTTHAALISQLIGTAILALVIVWRKYLLSNQAMRDILILISVAIIMFTMSGYVGTSLSLQNSLSNRYTTCMLLLTVILTLSMLRVRKFKHQKLIVYILAFLVLTSGVKSGVEWTNVRHGQSKALNFECVSKNIVAKNRCFELAFGQSFFKDENEFRTRLNSFLNLY